MQDSPINRKTTLNEYKELMTKYKDVQRNRDDDLLLSINEKIDIKSEKLTKSVSAMNKGKIVVLKPCVGDI